MSPVLLFFCRRWSLGSVSQGCVIVPWRSGAFFSRCVSSIAGFQSTQALVFLIAVFYSIVSHGDEPSGAVPETRIIENSLGMKFVLVPAGEFRMGSDEPIDRLAKDFGHYGKDEFGNDRLELPDEKPVHRVRITKPFFLGQHEVTVGQFRKYLEESNRTPESVSDGTGGYGFDPNKPAQGDAFAGRDPKYSWKNPGFAQTELHPVTNVTFEDAMAFCQWLSAKEGVKYRLPTEAEWEYACKAGTRTRYCNGDDPQALIKIANTFDAGTVKNWQNYPDWQPFALQGSDGHDFTAPVGSYSPNAFGVYDMHGNVWEWCSDYYSEDYYAQSPVEDPQGPESGRVRIRRGGSWHTWALYARSTYRNWNSESTRYTLVGMRLVREEVPFPYRVTEDVVYGHKDGLALTLDVLEPLKNANGLGLVLVSSGSWNSRKSDILEEEESRRQTDHWTQGLLKGGFTLFVVRHGSSPRYTVPEMVPDILRSVRFVRANAARYQVDPLRLGITSGSSGGHLALMAAMKWDDGTPQSKDPIERVSSRTQAVVAWFAPTDFINWMGPKTYAFIALTRPELFERILGKVNDLEPQLKEISPIYFVNKDSPPLLLIHGDADKTVPLHQSKLMQTKYEELGLKSKLLVHPGGGHSGWPGVMDQYPAVWDWFHTHLK
jgi:sulfatase modifying factor 1